MEIAEAAIEARETAQHDQEADANTAAAKEKSVTERYNSESQRSHDEEIMGNDNRTLNKAERKTETTEVNESDSMTCDT